MRTNKIIGTGLALFAVLYMAGCVYPVSREVPKSQIEHLLDSAPHDFYRDDEGRIIADKDGGLKFESDSGWERISREEINLPDLLAKGVEATTLSIEDTGKKTYTYEATLLQIPQLNDPSAKKLELKTNLKGNIFYAESYESGHGGGGAGGSGGSGGGGGCFTPETPVVMSDNTTKPIKAIQIGDEVKSFDFSTNQATSNTVIALFKFPQTEHLVINGIEVTETHPFCIGKGEWKEAGMLKVGDVLIGDDNCEIRIETIEKIQKDVTVHNFTVDGTHNYFVSNGEKNFLVHNKGGSG